MLIKIMVVKANILLLSGTCSNNVKVSINTAGIMITLLQAMLMTSLIPWCIKIEDIEHGKHSEVTKLAALTQRCQLLKSARRRMDALSHLSVQAPNCLQDSILPPYIASYPNDWKEHHKVGNSS
jgi:hypothetical protein